MLVRTDSKLYLKIRKLSEMGNFKDPDKGNETPGENNGILNGIGVNNDEDQEMFNGNSARSGSADSDTDLEDEGVTFNDIDEDMEIEFKDSDDTFDQSLDRIVRNMVNQETRGIAEDIASMRMEVSESVRNLGDAEDLVKEVMEALESSRRLLEDTSHDNDGSERVPNQDPYSIPIPSQNVSQEEADAGLMDLDCPPEDSALPLSSDLSKNLKEISFPVLNNCTESDTATTSSTSSFPVIPTLFTKPTSPQNVVPDHFYHHQQSSLELSQTISKPVEKITDIHNYSASLQCLPECDRSPPQISEPKPPSFKLKLQPKKPPVSVKEVRIPRCFTPPPTRRDLSSLSDCPIKPLVRGKPLDGHRAWAMRETSLMDAWEEAKIMKVFEKTVGKGKEQKTMRMYKVKFDDSTTKDLTAKQLAHLNELDMRIPVGERVIAVYKDEDQEEGNFFPAVISEGPKLSNKNRYLVFFDDGYAGYLDHKDIRLIYEKDQDVWKDVDKGSRNFIMNYIQKLPSKFMITLKEGDKVRTELNGKFEEAEVNDVDASLAQIVFSDETCNWIYRGSPRFEPIAKRTEPLEDVKRKGDLRKVNIPLMEPQPFTDHDCGPECVQMYPYKASKHKRSNPLRIPQHLGWRREIYSGDLDDYDWAVKYRTPCGRLLR